MRFAGSLLLAALAACSPASPGTLVLHGQSRKDGVAAQSEIRWEAKKTALIICDMWDNHTCKSAARRVSEMVPKLNELLRATRAKGVLVIHSPSDVIAFYKDYPQRAMVLAQPVAPAPMDIIRRPYDPKCEGPLPFDMDKWHCDCDPQCPDVRPYPWTREHAGVELGPQDAISADGKEIWNLCEARGLTNIIMTGVHTNYCITNRPFGIRQMRMLGRSVVLVRDMTDSLYNPKEPPHVSHQRGTELMIEHIERYWCPTILSSDLTAS